VRIWFGPSQITEDGTVVAFNVLSVVWDGENKNYDARLFLDHTMLPVSWYCDDPSDVYNVMHILLSGESPTVHDE
jgi:hypothetical protein